MKDRLLIAAGIALGVVAALIGLAARSPFAAAFFGFMWSFALSFIQWRRAWLWPLLLIAWLPLGIALGGLPAQVNGVPWCPRGPVNPWQIALVVSVVTFVFAGAGALTSLAVSFVVSIGPWSHSSWVRFFKPALDWGGCALAVLLVLYAALSISEPLQPYALGERYCWDEFCFRVTGVARVKSIPASPRPVVAKGTFYVVSAKLESPWWGRFIWSPAAVYVVSYDGSAFEHSPEGQQAEDALAGRTSDCHQIPGAAEAETIVFDLPDNVVQPRLIVRDTEGFEGFLGGMRLDLHYERPAFNLRYD